MCYEKCERKEGHENNQAARWNKMKEHLNLSEEQAANIKASREAYHSQAKAIRENEKFSSAEKKEKLMALHRDNKDSFKKILTPDQLSKMKEYRKEAHKNKKNKKEFKAEENTK